MVCVCCLHACIKISTPMSLYTYLMSLNKYDCHIANISHTAIMLHAHIDPTFLHMSAKMQETSISTLHVIDMHVPATNMPLKC